MKIEKIEVKRPGCNPSFPFVNAIAHLDSDLSHLLPYLNATREKAQYFPKTPYIRFFWEGHRVVIERSQVRVSLFGDDQAAREGAEKLIDLIRGIEAKKNEITPNHTPYDPPTVMNLFKLLPQISACEKCGYQTCMAFAAALAADEADIEACTELSQDPGQNENSIKLKELLGG